MLKIVANSRMPFAMKRHYFYFLTYDIITLKGFFCVCVDDIRKYSILNYYLSQGKITISINFYNPS